MSKRRKPIQQRQFGDSQHQKNFSDGISSLTRNLSNTRNAVNTNEIVSKKLTFKEMNEIYKTGIGSKIVRIKTDTALREGLIFYGDTAEESEDFYNRYLKHKVSEAARWMLAFGRGVVVIVDKTEDDQRNPLMDGADRNNLTFHVFDGSMVTGMSPDMNLISDRYYKPEFYTIRGVQFHHSRVIDFSYVKPREVELSNYQYGGISEFELIHEQLINDGVIQRAAPMVLDKASVPVYNIKGFRSALQSKQEMFLLDYFSALETARSVAGAVLMDSEDVASTLNQTLTNLSETDQIGLRRLAMVTSIPLAMLVGENVKGLNSTGDNEMDSFFMMIEALQQHYLYRPLNELMQKIGLPECDFKQPEQMTPIEKADLDGKWLDNALKIMSIGGDPTEYLKERGISIESNLMEDFPEEDGEDDLIEGEEDAGDQPI